MSVQRKQSKLLGEVHPQTRGGDANEELMCHSAVKEMAGTLCPLVGQMNDESQVLPSRCSGAVRNSQLPSEKQCGTHLLGSYFGREEACGCSFLPGCSLLFYLKIFILFIICVGGELYAYVNVVFHGRQKRVTDPLKPEL